MREDGFAIDPNILASAHPVAEWPLSSVLLQDDRAYPWLLLVPRRAGAIEFADLTKGDRAQLIEEIAGAQSVVRGVFKAEKLNTATLGLAVRQLHVNIIARFTADAAWPKPVWGMVERVSYSPAELTDRLGRLRRAFAEGAP